VEQTISQTLVESLNGPAENFVRDAFFEDNFEIVVGERKDLVDETKLLQDSWGGGSVLEFFNGVNSS
jgi:hypothetical protein